jgi:ATP-dependent DNA helicase MPH1
MKLKVDRLAANTWVFPIGAGMLKRDYQYNIIKNSLFENCLVALPTGLGKTFIAATIMLNCELFGGLLGLTYRILDYRWFPDGKLIFVAPTKPLVNQQIEACHNICGIPQEHFSIMMGGVSVERRVSDVSRLSDNGTQPNIFISGSTSAFIL